MPLAMSASPVWRADSLVLAALVAALGLRLVLAPPAPEPALVPAPACEPWMADALPGVGAKRRDATAAAIRAGDVEAVPKQGRESARACFRFDAGTGVQER